MNMNWPADTVERRPIAYLKAYAANARTHSPEQVAQLAASIKEFGFAIPILLDEAGEIIAGHGRVLAAMELGLDEVPCMVAKGWTEKQIKAYRLADNQLALNAGWDLKLLAAELEDLPGMESLIGFSEFDLETIFNVAQSKPLPTEEEARKTLIERFGVPPFSVLDARAGYWQERKSAWIALGIESELGRGENLLKLSEHADEAGSPGGSARKAKRLAREALAERKPVQPGNGWGNGGPARRDPAFYAKKREWEKANGRAISTTEFRQKYWDGYGNGA